MNPFKKALSIVLAALNIFSAHAKLPEAQVERNQTNPIETEYDSAKSNQKTILDKAYDNYLTSITDSSEICNNVDIDKILSSMETVLKERDRNEYNPNLATIEAMTDTLKLISELKNDSTYNGIIYNDVHKQWEIDVKNLDQYNITPNRYVRQYTTNTTSFIDLDYDLLMSDFVEIIIPIIFNYTYRDSNVTVYINPEYLHYISDDTPMTITDIENELLALGYSIENTTRPNMSAIGNLGVSVSGNGIYEGHSYDDPEIEKLIQTIQDRLREKCNKITSQDPNKILSILPYLFSSLAKVNSKFKLLSYDLSNEAKANKVSSGNRNASIYIIDGDEQSAYEFATNSLTKKDLNPYLESSTSYSPEESPERDNHVTYHNLKSEFTAGIKAEKAETDPEKVQAALKELHKKNFGSHSLDDFNNQEK